MNDSDPVLEDSAGTVPTVARSVLSSFFAELTAIDGFAEIGPKLRKIVLDDGVFSEPVIRVALFGHDL